MVNMKSNYAKYGQVLDDWLEHMEMGDASDDPSSSDSSRPPSCSSSELSAHDGSRVPTEGYVSWLVEPSSQALHPPQEPFSLRKTLPLTNLVQRASQRFYTEKAPRRVVTPPLPYAPKYQGYKKTTQPCTDSISSSDDFEMFENNDSDACDLPSPESEETLSSLIKLSPEGDCKENQPVGVQGNDLQGRTSSPPIPIGGGVKKSPRSVASSSSFQVGTLVCTSYPSRHLQFELSLPKEANVQDRVLSGSGERPTPY